MVVYDTTYPENRGTGSVVVTVTRNPKAPRFQADRYERTVDEKIELGTSILQLAARDEDGVGYLI